MMTRISLSLTLSVSLALLTFPGCATDAGDAVDCPTCDDVTELLVGARCVPIAEVEPCGPDGHAHGDACHCFSGQEPTSIGATQYCLQQGCAGSGEEVGDPDEQACEEAALAPEQVSAVTDFASFETVHVDDGKVVEIALPQNEVSYVHCAAFGPGHLRIDLSAADVLDAALDAAGAELDLEPAGANPDCPNALPAVLEVHLEEGDYPHPVVLRFKAGSLAALRLVLRSPAAQ